MKRRGFLALLGLAPAAPLVAKELLKQPLPELEEDYDDYDDYGDDYEPSSPSEPEKDWQPSGFEMALLDHEDKELMFPSYRRAVVMVAPWEAGGVPVRAIFPQACEFWGTFMVYRFHKVGATTLPIHDGQIGKFCGPVSVGTGTTVRADMHLTTTP